MSANGPQPYGVRAHVDAWQVTAENIQVVADWCAGGENLGDCLVFDAADGRADTAEVGDWVVRGTTGEFFALPDWSFCQHYYREDRPAKVTHGVLTGEALRVKDRRDGQR